MIEMPTEPAAARSRSVPPHAGRTARVTCAGELDVRSLPDLDRSLRSAEADATLVVLDLADVEFVDACGAELLLAAHRRLLRAGRQLVVARSCPEVRWYLALTGLDEQLDVGEPHPEQPPLAHSWVLGMP